MWSIKLARYSLALYLGLMAPLLLADAVVWDVPKEKAVADKLSHDLAYGRILWLGAGTGNEFPVLFTRAVPESHSTTAVVLVHGMGGHPDWPEVISPLRKLLADEGWTTLSVQMPVLPAETPVSDYGKTIDESQKRLSTAIDYLMDYGYEKVVLAGYGFGAAVAAVFLQSDENHEVHAFAGISMLARKYLDPAIDLYASLEVLELPVLDIYGSDDLKTIINSADERRVAARRNGHGNDYKQVVIWNADHYFTGKEHELSSQIILWLDEALQDKNTEIPY